MEAIGVPSPGGSKESFDLSWNYLSPLVDLVLTPSEGTPAPSMTNVYNSLYTPFSSQFLLEKRILKSPPHGVH